MGSLIHPLQGGTGLTGGRTLACPSSACDPLSQPPPPPSTKDRGGSQDPQLCLTIGWMCGGSGPRVRPRAGSQASGPSSGFAAFSCGQFQKC
ncbi:hypothetical protein CapIbe_021342 [Capra ibex]